MTVLDILDYRAWKPVIVTGACVLAVLGTTYGAGYWHGTRRTETKVSVAERAADIAKGENRALKAQALAKDAEIEAKDAGLAKARADVARKVAELAAYRASMGAVPANVPPLDESIQTGMVDLAPLVAKQDEVIQAQANFIKLQDVKISDLVISRDLHAARAEASEREALNLRAALAAKDGLIRAAQIKGFAYGFAFGAASGGYAGYRIGSR